jgi:hypothetical protein
MIPPQRRRSTRAPRRPLRSARASHNSSPQAIERLRTILNRSSKSTIQSPQCPPRLPRKRQRIRYPSLTRPHKKNQNPQPRPRRRPHRSSRCPIARRLFSMPHSKRSATVGQPRGHNGRTSRASSIRSCHARTESPRRRPHPLWPAPLPWPPPEFIGSRYGRLIARRVDGFRAASK